MGRDLERARPLLEKMGQNIFHAGEAGAGQTAKTCNNMLLGIWMVGSLGGSGALDFSSVVRLFQKNS